MSEDREAKLEYLNTKPEGSPVSVMEHTGEVIIRLADNCAERPLDYFEVASYIIKEERQSKENQELLKFGKPKGPNFVENAKTNVRLQAQLFPKQQLGEEEEEAGEAEGGEDAEHQEEETVNEGEIPNVIGNMQFMNEVGVGLNETETILLQQAIQKLIRSKPLATARFWGKVMGIQNDYYIAEAEFNDGERPHAAQEEEEKNEPEEGTENKEDKPRIVPKEEDSGPNQYSYFVCTQLGGPWKLLPDITPAQIQGSRCIRQMFSGTEKGPIAAPEGRFQGGEYELLRCFISRVTHSCTLAPKGLYNLEEEPEEGGRVENVTPIAMAEEPEYKPLEGLKSFVHCVPAILDQGRCEFYIFEEDQQDEEGNEKEPVVEHGPPILTPITEDKSKDEYKCWSLREVNGVSKRYWLRSNVWPGLHIVSNENGSRMVMMYFGTGMKAQKPLEWPPLPVKKPPPPPPKEEEEKNENEEEEKGEEGAEKTNTEETTGEESATGTATNEESGTYDSNYDSSAQ